MFGIGGGFGAVFEKAEAIFQECVPSLTTLREDVRHNSVQLLDDHHRIACALERIADAMETQVRSRKRKNAVASGDIQSVSNKLPSR
jgi:hypothetical protein